ncbi:MAG TPA: membrane protein insertase YidC [Syntrophales bacterium]|nr:membrane protein insertase YidC [Syntrophales bacterium]
MSTNVRTFLAILLSFIVVFIYQYFFAKNLETQKQEQAQTQTQTQTAQPPATAPVGAPAVPAAARPAPAAAVRAAAPAKDIRVETPLYTAVFSTRGGALKSLKLKEYKATLDEGSPLIEMVAVQEGSELPLSTAFTGSTIDLPGDVAFEADRKELDLTGGAGPGRLVFTCAVPGQYRVEKIYTFLPDRYSFDLEVRFVNATNAALNQSLSIRWLEELSKKGLEEEGAVARAKNSTEREAGAKLEKKAYGPDIQWGGFENKFFLAAMIPKQPALTTATFARDARGQVVVTLDGPKNTIPPGQPGVFNYTLFVGPKEYNRLKAEDAGLEAAINVGNWMKWLAYPILFFMQYLYKYVGNYGLVIILITMLTKLLFWPLGNKSYKSMKEMQKVQPKLNEIKERYKDDKQKMNAAVMELYKTHKINPLGGCLPMIIQIPVFIALYQLLSYAIELRHAPFVWWIQDLSAKDPYYITPIIMGATMLIQQKMSPPMGDPMQQKMMLLMPVVFTFLFLNFPSGLVIYWLVNNVLSIGQQYYINKSPTA